MQELQTVRRGGRVLWLRPEALEPGAMPGRPGYDREALGELADSIGRYGVLQPLTVCRREQGYALVAGRRRLRAAQMAGLEEVPCLLMELDEEDSGVLALVENWQRREPDVAERARILQRLMERFSLDTEEAARRLGKSPAALRRLLELLELPEDVLQALGMLGLGERHGRALLRLPDAAQQRRALLRMAEGGLSGAQAEALVEELLAPAPEEKREGRTRFVLKDARVFLNSLEHSVALMRQGGVAVTVEKEETEEALKVIVHIRR